MKKTNKRAFTIIELVIVIGVIAILAAVLIPTFSNLIKKANVASDTQLIRNLNTALALDKASGNEHKTMQNAINAAEDNGFNVAKISSKISDNEILWDSKNDVFCYLNGSSIEYVPNTISILDMLPVNDYRLWKIYDEGDVVPSASEQTYSIYLNGGDYSQAVVDDSFTITVGLDVGKTNGISGITYDRSSASSVRNVVINTNSENTTLNIKVYESSDKTQSDTVSIYGLTGLIEVYKGGSHSVHTYGYVGFVTVHEGIVLAKDGKLEAAYLPIVANASANEDGGIISNVYVKAQNDKTYAIQQEKTNINEENVHYLYSGTSTDVVEIENAISEDLNNYKEEAIASATTSATENGFFNEVVGVARIGMTGYATLDAAVKAAKTSDEIVLLSDITTSNINVGSSSNKNARQFTINLNGYKITQNKISYIFKIYDTITIKNGSIESIAYGTNSCIMIFCNLTLENVNVTQTQNIGGLIYISTGGILNLYSGTITAVTPKDGAIYVYKDGTLNMYGGKIINKYDGSDPTLYNYSTTCIYAKGNVNIYDGILEAKKICVYIERNSNSTNKTNINDGEFTSENPVWIKQGEVEISGGTFVGGAESVYVYGPSTKISISGGEFSVTNEDKSCVLNIKDEYNSSVEIEVTGGIFHGFNPNESSETIVKDGYVSTENNGVWIVTKED